MTGEGIAAILTSAATLVGVIINGALQWKQSKITASNSDKLDLQGGKIDDLHAATTSLVEATGTHQVLK